MEVVLVPQFQTVLHLPVLYRWEGQGDWCSSDVFSALLNKGAEHTQQITPPLPVAEQGVRLHRHLRRARQKSTPSLQALAWKHIVASLLGHRRLVALCSLAISQVSHYGP